MSETTAVQPKFCINCAYVKYMAEVDKHPKCGALGAQKADPVYGYSSPYCTSARSETGACRPEGVLFVAKPISGCSCCSKANPAESVVEYLNRPCVKQWLASSLFRAPSTNEEFDAHGMPTIIYGHQGCGKTTHAKALAAHYGKTQIVDDWRPGVAIPDNAIALTDVYVEGCIMFEDAVWAAGLAICYQHQAQRVA